MHDFDDFDQNVQKLIKRHNIPGASISIIEKGGLAGQKSTVIKT